MQRKCTVQNAEDAFNRGRDGCFDDLPGVADHVRSQDDILKHAQRTVGRERFGDKSVKGCAGDTSISQSKVKRMLINEAAPCGVHQVSRGLHHRQRSSIYQNSVRRIGGGKDADDIGLAKYFVRVDKLDIGWGIGRLGACRHHKSNAEWPEPLRGGASNPSEANHSYRASAKHLCRESCCGGARNATLQHCFSYLELVEKIQDEHHIGLGHADVILGDRAMSNNDAHCGG